MTATKTASVAAMAKIELLRNVNNGAGAVVDGIATIMNDIGTNLDNIIQNIQEDLQD